MHKTEPSVQNKLNIVGEQIKKLFILFVIIYKSNIK